MSIIFIGLAGSVGAICRHLIYVLERSLPSHSFPYGTLFINVLGCMLAGVFFALAEKAAPDQRQTLMLLSIGFVGSFTTFSSFCVETLRLAEASFIFQAALNISLNVFLGILTVWVAKMMASQFI